MTILCVEGFKKHFFIHHLNKKISAVNEVNFTVEKGEFIGIVGKSGSGKSTILKSIYRSYLPDEGAIIYDSDFFGAVDLCKATEREMVYLRKH